MAIPTASDPTTSPTAATRGAKAPPHDSPAYWRLVLAQRGKTDAYDREILVTGVGIAGPIFCTREYARHRLDVVRATRREPRR